MFCQKGGRMVSVSIRVPIHLLPYSQKQCSSCKNTYGGMVQLFMQTLGGMVNILVREWFTLKCFMGGWHPPSTRVLVRSVFREEGTFAF